MPRQIVMACRCRKGGVSIGGKMKRAEIDICWGILTKYFPLYNSGHSDRSFCCCLMPVIWLWCRTVCRKQRFGGRWGHLFDKPSGQYLSWIINRVNVIAAQYVGAKNQEQLKKTVNTAITVSLLSGILAVIGICVNTHLSDIHEHSIISLTSLCHMSDLLPQFTSNHGLQF